MTATHPISEDPPHDPVSFGERTVQVTPWERGVPGPHPMAATELRWGLLDGEAVVAKVAGSAGRDRLRREAEVLSRCATLRVTRVVELLEAAEHTELRLRRVEGLTLADAALMSPTERTRALAALCRALDGLHHGGWAHRGLTANHVLVDTRGRVTLCSLSAAEQVPTGRPDTAVSEDRADLVTLVTEVLLLPSGLGSATERIRWKLGSRQVLRSVQQRRDLLTPEALGRLLAGSRLPTSSVGGRHDERPARRAPRVVVAAGLGALAAAGAAAAVAALGPGSHDAPQRTCHVAAPPPNSGLTTVPPGASVLSVDVDGDDCQEQAQVMGRDIEVDGVRYRVGRPGDIAALGDWNCDGTATVALLRPATGEVFEFSGWAGRTDTEEARMTATIEGAVGIGEPNDPCGPPRVRLADSSIVDAHAPEGP